MAFVEILAIALITFSFSTVLLSFFPELRPSGDFGKVFDFLTQKAFSLSIFLFAMVMLFIFG